MRIAFLGIGLMGLPMARHVVAAGHEVCVWNRSPGKAQAVAGARVAETPAEAVRGAQCVLSIVSDGEAVLQLGKAAPPDAGALWVDMSSTQPEQARAMAAQLGDAVGFLDAPVSGGTQGAKQASLAIMVGGSNADFVRAAPVLSLMGQAVRVGPTGAGQLAKLANQLIVAVTIGAVAEATLLLESGGADPSAVRQALRGGFADSTILQQHGARMSARDFVPGGLSRLQLKDLNNILNEAQACGVTLPMAAQVQSRFARYVEELGGAERDHSGLFEELLDTNSLV